MGNTLMLEVLKLSNFTDFKLISVENCDPIYKFCEFDS